MKIFAWSVLVMIPITLFGKSQSKGNVICVNETNIVKLLQGRDGRDGRDGSKGDVGLQGPEGKQGQKGENGATGLPGKSCSCQLKKAVEALMKTTADVSNATIAATGQGSVNYRGIADHSNTEAKVDILTVNQDPISSRDELFQVVCSSKSWENAPKVVIQRLESLVDVVLKSRSDSTTKAYERVISKFFQWCKEKEIPLTLPFPVSVIALFLFSKAKDSRSVSSVQLASAALKWLHSFTPDNNPNPLDSPFCKNIIESAKRTYSKPIRKKKPVSTGLIKKLIDKFGRSNNNLKDLRIAAMCSLGFAGFFRFKELSNIQADHIDWHDDHLRILVPQSKTDIYREGQFVYIQKIGGKYCPVSVLSKYMGLASIEFDSSAFLFRPLVFHKRGSFYSLEKGALSYSRSRELFKEALTTLGYDATKYGLHSLRSGGITSVVQNSNNSIPERLLKLHGRWKTDTAKDMYVQESLHSRLEVSSYLGL